VSFAEHSLRRIARREGRALVASEGYVEVTGGKVWYRIAGDGDGVPLLLLHGGPGFTSEYLEPLETLGETRPVVFYDQLGCGWSDRPEDPALWTVGRFVEEVALVREALGLERVHILGQSWGSMLAVDYLLTQPAGVCGLVLASPPLSIRRWTDDARRLIATLPAETQEVIASHERDGYFSCPEYQAAIADFYRRYVCRMRPWPPALERAFAGAGQPVYQTMWGPSEFTVTGVLASYERADRLPEIAVPALFTCGRFDEATPESTSWYQSKLDGSRVQVFEQSAHLAHLEQAGEYAKAIHAFLRECET
jgi:proline-specific peptidase